MSSKMWGGRFSQGPDAIVQKFTESISYDSRLYPYDIAGSIAHAKTLAKAKIITPKELQAIITGLHKIQKDIAAGTIQFDQALEDIHMNIESILTERIGLPAKKLHTGRSRNDQVATDMRLYVKHQIEQTIELLNALMKTLTQKAAEAKKTIMPGYTHLQIAQPVLVAHHLLAYVEMFLRDRDRLQDVLKRTDVMPLGSAALAGTTYPLDRAYTARLLGFKGITENSLDAVSDRDYQLELLSVLSIVAIHLSRMSEEIIIWNTAEFKFITLDDRYATGSSIMPQKKNPDIAELVRGKTGRVIGNLMAQLTMMKGLPLAYNRDMQEDKERLFDSVETIQLSLMVLDGLWQTATLHYERMYKAALAGYSTATDLADYLVRLGIPFREAHEITGKLVFRAVNQNILLQDMSLIEMQRIDKRITQTVFAAISLEASVEARKTYGGTAPTQVAQALQRARKRIK